MDNLRSNLTIRCWLAGVLNHFHGNRYGNLKSLLESHSLFGQRLKVKFWPWIICGKGGFVLWNGVVYAKRVVNHLNTSSFIVLTLKLSGLSHFLYLGFHGLCQLKLLIFWPAGWEGLVNLVRLWSGVKCHIVLCGCFGANAITVFLRGRRLLPWILNPAFLELCMSGCL